MYPMTSPSAAPADPPPPVPGPQASAVPPSQPAQLAPSAPPSQQPVPPHSGTPRPAPHDPASQSPAPQSPETLRLEDPPQGRIGVGGLRPVSPKLIPARYIAGIPGYVIGLLAVAGAIVATVLTGWWWPAAVGILPLILVLQGLAFTPRRVRALGYLDGEEDLTVASGIMFRSVTTVPYGRVQSVKIDEGPVDRRYGLARITLTTAAAGSTLTIPGLPKAEAERMRTLLSERGIETMAAL